MRNARARRTLKTGPSALPVRRGAWRADHRPGGRAAAALAPPVVHPSGSEGNRDDRAVRVVQDRVDDRPGAVVSRVAAQGPAETKLTSGDAKGPSPWTLA